jgi:hypothetical protein
MAVISIVHIYKYLTYIWYFYLVKGRLTRCSAYPDSVMDVHLEG